MFTGFSKETGEFLWELAFHNERPWFLEHKEQFERTLNEPFRALAREVYDELRRLAPEEEWPGALQGPPVDDVHARLRHGGGARLLV